MDIDKEKRQSIIQVLQTLESSRNINVLRYRVNRALDLLTELLEDANTKAHQRLRGSCYRKTIKNKHPVAPLIGSYELRSKVREFMQSEEKG